MTRIVVHPSDFINNPAHYNILADEYFFKQLENKNYKVIFSNKINEINKNDVILFVEAKNCVSKLFMFRTASTFIKLKIIIKALINIKSIRQDDFLKRINKLKNKKILVVLEGKLHAPENHKINLLNYCDYILTWNDDLISNNNFIKINLPQEKDFTSVSNIPYKKKKLLTNISSNLYSSVSGELYSERREIIKFAENQLDSEFDLYGFNWNKPATILQKINKNRIPHYNSYVGKVDNKATVFSEYRFAIIYENYQTNGYITEKIFDCLRSNCVPIYLGAPNIDKLLPNDIYIDRRKFKNNKDLIDFLINLSELDYNNYLNCINKFLGSKEFKNYFSTQTADIIHKTIQITNNFK